MPTDTLDRIRAGDERALGALLEDEWGGLVRFLLRRLPSRDAAQDAAQETFVRLWTKREQWKAGSPRALLYRIATNVATDAIRRAEVHRRWRRSAGSSEPISPPTPADELDESETHRRFRQALRAMAPKRREVFRLVRDEALSYREVAEVLGLSPQTVANHMSLALRELRHALGDVLPTAERDPEVRDRTRSNDG